MKALLTLTAVLEASTGAALMVAPSAMSSALLGARLESPAAEAIARVAGAAVSALGVACWSARHAAERGHARGMILGMLVYNSATVAVLVHGSTTGGLKAIGLWPAVMVHAALAVWCVVCLARRRNTSSDVVTARRQEPRRNLAVGEESERPD